MRSKRQNKKLLLLILLLTVTVGFALLSTTLQINGISRIKGNIWNIHWDSTSIRINNDSIATATGPEVSTVTTTDDTVAFEVNLELPGEFFEFTVDAVNEGTIDGYINSVTKFIYDKDDYDADSDEATPIEPTDITFTVVYDDNGQVPANGDLLAKRVDSTTPTRRTYKVRVEFNSTATSVPEIDTTYMCVFKTTYGQNASNNGGGSGSQEPEEPSTPSNPYLTTFDGTYTYTTTCQYEFSSESEDPFVNVDFSSEWDTYLRNNGTITETCGVFLNGTVCLTDNIIESDFEDAVEGDYTASNINTSGLKGYAKAKAEEMLSKGAIECGVSSDGVWCYSDDESAYGTCFLSLDYGVQCSDRNYDHCSITNSDSGCTCM